MNKTLLAMIALSVASAATAQTEVLRLTMTDGTVATYNVADVESITFDEETASPAESFAGVYAGEQTLTVGGMYNYSTQVDYTLTAETDGALTVSIPEYSLSGTMMGDLTLGALTISGLTYDEERGGFYRRYADDGMTQHFLAVNGGSTVFDKDYPLGGESSILITLTDGGIHVENPFKLGAMPLSLSASFEGTSK